MTTRTRAATRFWLLITKPKMGGRRCRSESTWRPVASALTLRASAEESTCERGAGGSWTPTGLSRGISLALFHPLRHPKRKQSLYRCGRNLASPGSLYRFRYVVTGTHVAPACPQVAPARASFHATETFFFFQCASTLPRVTTRGRHSAVHYGGHHLNRHQTYV